MCNHHPKSTGFVPVIPLRLPIESVWFAVCFDMYRMIESDDVQNIGEHVLVGEPPRKLKVKVYTVISSEDFYKVSTYMFAVKVIV